MRILSFAAVACVAVLAAAAPAWAVTADEPLAGVSNITPGQLEAELDSVNPGHVHSNIAQLYVEWGYRFGIRSDLAFAQMLLETNYLRYGGDVSWRQNNFAGIGATGGGVPGITYGSPELGVIGHYAHLAWYMFPDQQNPYCSTAYDPRHFGPGHRNTAQTLRQLGGQWAVPGTTYGADIARIANRIHSRPIGGNTLGSFNEVVGSPAAGLASEYYFTWYDSLTSSGMAGNWILVGNQGSGDARVEIWIGGVRMHDPGAPSNDFFIIPEGGRVTPIFSSLKAGPVRVVCTSGQPIIASQRVLYRDSFNEIMGTPAGGLSDSYEFTWYDLRPENGMAGNWILVSNQGAASADVEIWIGGIKRAEYSAARGNALAPGAIVTPDFPFIIGGPVVVKSTNHQPLIVSQRVLYKDSFNEVMGVPTTSLGSEYLFTWYDLDRSGGVMHGDWILAANHGGVPADVDMFIGGVLKARYSAATGNPIPPGGMVTPIFDHVTDGPVRVVSTNGQPLMVSQRVLFRNTFEEVQGTKPSQLGTDQLFTWYDSTLSNYMWGNWILVANQGSGEARVEIYIGGVRMHDPGAPANDFFTIPEGGRITPQFHNLMDGPARVVCTSGQQLMVSQRVLFKEGLIR
ncbi:MAG: glucosaminidase domain-containing protein [Actinobacteria bacterium]|nr:glucosaminidase domain-containing protein [Actinomycetota bacterium]MCL5883689.1 glucosaminidase domain-containing protein [Actinomycetota bacterium]